MTTTATLPETGFVRISTVLAHLPIGRSSWWAGVKNGMYPPAYKLGPATTAWKSEDILALIKKLGSTECAPPSGKSAGAAAIVLPPATTQRRATKRGHA